ncbi:unnamed protein product [Lactuca saligna]|uniref:Uncharacterized protein n=1 Tax=Lactuca saligna TaxID=75948 RepID=A0AA35VIH5_LACSI|nr:unnamed protein product [Lactuca saligna]
MPPKCPPPTTIPKNFNFFYGHHKPTQNRPTVRGGVFSNRQTLNPSQNHQRGTTNFDLEKWNPEQSISTSSPRPSPSEHYFSVAQTLSPIARYIVDSFRKHKHWGPPVVADLNKLRRVTPKLVAEKQPIPGS